MQSFSGMAMCQHHWDYDLCRVLPAAWLYMTSAEVESLLERAAGRGQLIKAWRFVLKASEDEVILRTSGGRVGKAVLLAAA